MSGLFAADTAKGKMVLGMIAHVLKIMGDMGADIDDPVVGLGTVHVILQPKQRCTCQACI